MLQNHVTAMLRQFFRMERKPQQNTNIYQDLISSLHLPLLQRYYDIHLKKKNKKNIAPRSAYHDEPTPDVCTVNGNAEFLKIVLIIVLHFWKNTATDGLFPRSAGFILLIRVIEPTESI